MYANIYSSFIPNGQNMETTHMSFSGGGTDKLLIHKKHEWISMALCWIKSHSQNITHSMIPYLCDILENVEV